jgi:glutamate N-acetyltransferase/amino-acid N-acetyltransferase
MKIDAPISGDLMCRGFKASGISCGIKRTGAKDLALILSDVPAVTAGVFTKSRLRAAPVDVDVERLKRRFSRGVIVNSGNANAATGKDGRIKAERMTGAAEKALGLSAGDMLVCSTGLIGSPLPIEKISAAVPTLAAALDEGGLKDAVEAIMTTDAFPKTVVMKGVVGGREITIAGIAKGAGMIRPDMATLLAFFVTDMNITRAALRGSLKSAVDRSFNSTSVDNDTSTNDTALVFANGVAGGRAAEPDTKAALDFTRLLTDASVELAKMIVRDGEGATKFIEINVTGAKSDRDARRAVATIADSMLVKTGLFGGDPNWGRVFAALGRAGIAVDADRLDISMNGVKVATRGQDSGREREASEALKQSDIKVDVDLGLGRAKRTFWTSDLSFDYVKLNSHYRT